MIRENPPFFIDFDRHSGRIISISEMLYLKLMDAMRGFGLQAAGWIDPSAITE
jgi:hypothetical protein